jgi:hypothetical protein
MYKHNANKEATPARTVDQNEWINRCEKKETREVEVANCAETWVITNYFHVLNNFLGWEWWLTPIILATQELEIWRIVVGGHVEQKVSKIPSQQTSQRW